MIKQCKLLIYLEMILHFSEGLISGRFKYELDNGFPGPMYPFTCYGISSYCKILVLPC